MKVTFDTNCIIDIELNEGSSADLLPLLALHESARIDIRVSGIVASERLRDGGYSPTFAGFVERVQQLSRRPIHVLKPLGHWDVTFWDEGLWADDEMVELEARIGAILFTEHPYEWLATARAAGIETLTVPSEDVVVWRK